MVFGRYVTVELPCRAAAASKGYSFASSASNAGFPYGCMVSHVDGLAYLNAKDDGIPCSGLSPCFCETVIAHLISFAFLMRQLPL